MSKMRNNDDAELMRRYGKVERRLRRAWWRQRAHAAARGMGHLLLWGVLLAAVDFAIDWPMLPGSVGRVTLLAANAVVLLGVFYLAWFRHLRAYDPVHLALNVERLHPSLQSLLVSYVQLHSPEGLEDDKRMSPGLVRAMCRQADEQAAPLNFGKIIHFRTLGPLAILGLLAISLVAAAVYIQPVMFEVFARRMLHPTSTLRYPTKTIIIRPPSNETIQQGSHVILSAIAGGEVPKEATLVMQGDDGPTEEQTVTVVAGENLPRGEMSFRLLDAMRSFNYYFRVGDTTTDTFRVEVIPPPTVTLHATLRYPDYLKRPPTESEILSVRVPEGASIDWRLQADRPLTEVKMTTEGAQAADMTLDTTGTAATASVSPDKSFSYGFTVTDRAHGFKYILDVRYMVQVVADRAPRVSLIRPMRDEKVTEGKTLDIAFAAGDDYGLASARLVYTVYRAGADTPDPEGSIHIPAFEDSPRTAPGRYTWELKQLEQTLKPGDLIQYAIEVSDNRPAAGGAGTGRSEQRRLSIVSVDEYLEWAREERKRILGGIKDAHDQEVQSAQTVSELSKDKKKDAPKKP